MLSLLSKILETGINDFKSNYQIMKKKYSEISAVNEGVKKISTIIGCTILMICLELN